MTPGFSEFEFDLPGALLVSLVGVFDKMQGAVLDLDNVTEIPESQGVYQLLLDDRIVYIGKTDAEAGLRRRLERHAWTIQHRQNLDRARVSFKAIRVFVFTAIDLETQLIRYYSAINPVPWNNSGFGSNDPGRDRDTTRLKAGGFDEQFPIDLDHAVELDLPSSTTAFAVLTALRRQLPYTLRIEGGRAGHPELSIAKVSIPAPPPRTTREVLLTILSALPAGWQATALAGRVILYREARKYAFGTTIGLSGNNAQ